MYVGAEVAISTANADISFDIMPLSIAEEEVAAQFVSFASAAPFASQELSGIIGTTKKPYDSDGSTTGGAFRVDFDRVFASSFTDSAGNAVDLLSPFDTIVDYGAVTGSVTLTLDKGLVTAVTTIDSDYGAFGVNQFGTLGYIQNTYGNIISAARISSETFDHDSDAGGNKLFSNTQINFDADEFKYYTDSA
jgi:hypothetical protein